MMTTPAGTGAGYEGSGLSGLRILMVEDEAVVATSLEDLLGLIDCRVVKAMSVARALSLVASEAIDGALLDVNLAGGQGYAVAAELDRRGIPFVFMTGYRPSDLDPAWRSRSVPVLQKPFLLEDLERVMTETFVTL